jgi:periplasmic copper chaperone A
VVEMRSTARKRTIVGFAVVALMIGLSAGSASAHVTIDTLGAVEQGSFAKLGFSVPNERDDSGTIELQVQFPADHPLVFVSVEPTPGWEVTITMQQLDPPVEMFGSSFGEAVDTITWTAEEGTQIGPGEFDWFWVSAGAMPTDVDVLEFPAVQTYASGEVVRWIEPQTEGGEEPEHPAPTVALVAATESANDAAAVDDDDDDDGTTLAVVALIVGGLGLVAGIAAIAIGRRRTAP